MHLVFINQYYPPDGAPTGIALAAVVEELAVQGHEVTVICAEGGYAGMRHKTERHKTQEGEVEGLNVEGRKSDGDSPRGGPAAPDELGRPRPSDPIILRIRATRFGRGTFFGKLLDYLSFYLGVAWQLAVMLPKPDRIVALTTPPYLSLLARVMSKLRGADHALWVMDIYPDVMVAHGILQQNSLAHRALSWLARWGMSGKRCAAVLTLGPDMAERLAKRCIGESTGARHLVFWVPLWSAGNETTDNLAVIERRHEMGWGDDELVVMYSGNMGLGHRFGEILEVGGQLSEGRGRFVFFGGGKRRGEIAEFIEKHPNAPVELHDYVPMEILATHLRSADVHLVSLDVEWTGMMLPSKLHGIFTAGRPVIFMGNENSSIGRWVSQSGGGWVIAPGDVNGLECAIHEARDPKVREARGLAAKSFAEANFKRQINVRRVADILVC